MQCPFYEEIVVAFCRAIPTKKMLPASRLLPTSPCIRAGYGVCPFYREMIGRLAGREVPDEDVASRQAPREGGSQ